MLRPTWLVVIPFLHIQEYQFEWPSVCCRILICFVLLFCKPCLLQNVSSLFRVERNIIHIAQQLGYGSQLPCCGLGRTCGRGKLLNETLEGHSERQRRRIASHLGLQRRAGWPKISWHLRLYAKSWSTFFPYDMPATILCYFSSVLSSFLLSSWSQSPSFLIQEGEGEQWTEMLI